MGNFDDLIPRAKTDGNPTLSRGNFDDLVPKQSLKPVTWQDEANSFLHEANAIPRAFANTASFGALDAIDALGQGTLKRFGVPITEEMKHPGAVSTPGKIGEFLASSAGALKGGPWNLASSVSKRLIPTTAKGLIPSVTREVIKGGAFGSALPGSLEERKNNAIANAVLFPVFKTAVEYLEPGSIRIAKGIIKPKGKFTPRSENIARTSLKEDVLRSGAEATKEAAQGKIDDLLQFVDDLASSSTIDVSLKPAFQRAGAAARKWFSEGKPDRAMAIIKEIENLANAKGLTPQSTLSARRFLNLRKAQDAVINELSPNAHFRTNLPADIEARQEFVGGMRKAFGQALPEAGQALKRSSNLIDVVEAAKARSGVSSRNNLFDIMDYGLGGIATGTGSNAVGALLAAKKLWQGGKALTARGMYKVSNLAKRFGILEPETLEATDVNQIRPALGSDLPARRLLPSPKTPITTSIQEPDFTGPKSLPTPRYIEQSPIIFGEPEAAQKVSLLKKYGINPFTGKMKATRLPSSYKAALQRLKESKGE